MTTPYYDATPNDGPRRAGPLLMSDQPMPHSADSELAVLACILQEPAATEDAVSVLDRESFYIPQHKQLWDACAAVKKRGQPLELLTVADQLEAEDQFEVMGGMDFLRSTRNSIATIANINTYIQKIQNHHNARKAIVACTDALGRLYEGVADNVPAILGDAERNLTAICGAIVDEGFVHIKEVLPDSFDIINGIANHDPDYLGIPTGLKGLDDILMGFKPGELIVLAARPSIGKTALALNIMKRMALFKSISVPVGIFSFEMGKEMIGLRFIIEDAEIDLKKLFQGRIAAAQWQGDMQKTCDRLGNSPIYIYDGRRDISSLRRHARKLAKEQGARAIFVDYVQLIKGDGGKKGDNREQEVAKISSDLKDLAKELHIPIIVLAQLGRAAEGQDAKMSHIRESGAIEQDADVVLLLQRTREVDDEDTAKAAAAGDGVKATVLIGKNRNGPTGSADLLYFPQFTMFADPSRILDSEIPV